MRVWPYVVLERELWGRGVMTIAGVDEVGVGAFAAPVLAAAEAAEELRSQLF
jgi:hypothetical protein